MTIAFFYSQSLFTMMLSDKERHRKVYNRYHNKVKLIIKKYYQVSVLENSQNKVVCPALLDSLSQKKIFKRSFDLLNEKCKKFCFRKVPMQYAVKLLYDYNFIKNEYQTTKLTSCYGDLVYVFNLANKELIASIDKYCAKEKQCCNNYFNIQSNGKDCMLLMVIEALKEGNLKFIDFLIDPITVAFLAEYYQYNPNSLWKYIINNCDEFLIPLSPEMRERVRCSDRRRFIDYRGLMARLLMKYNYVEGICISTMQHTMNSLDDRYKYENEDVRFLVFWHVYHKLNEVDRLEFVQGTVEVVYNNNRERIEKLIKKIEKDNVEASFNIGKNYVFFIQSILDRNNLFLYKWLMKKFVTYSSEKFLALIHWNANVKHDCLMQNYAIKDEEISDIKTFQKRVVMDLVSKENAFSSRWILDLLQSNDNYKNIHTESSLIILICDAIEQGRKEHFSKKKQCFEENEYESADEYTIFKVILDAIKKEEFLFIDFLIKPTTVSLLNKYYKYNPNNFWKELLKSPENYQLTFTSRRDEWLKRHTIDNKEKVVELLLKYDYIQNISPFKTVYQNSPTEDGSIYHSKHIDNYCSMMPLHIACKMNSLQVLEVLLRHAQENPQKLDSNSLDGDGYVPIHYAMSNANRDISLAYIKFLRDIISPHEIYLMLKMNVVDNDVVNIIINHYYRLNIETIIYQQCIEKYTNEQFCQMNKDDFQVFHEEVNKTVTAKKLYFKEHKNFFFS